jgi:asparagine synthase (glutamine-hydrolysing)
MCGISGILALGAETAVLSDLVQSMSNTLTHRGPDSKGHWVSKPGIAFGHTRLAIMDLSVNGAQPMHSRSRRFTICFNGEIYNVKQLQSMLGDNAVPLRGNSDTEAFLECINLFGLDWTLENARGMFAFGLWDAANNKLTLARDRLGEKPLYYGMAGDSFIFGSELKVFCCHPDFKREIDETALNAFFKYSYVPTPLCIFKKVKKLPAAHKIIGATPDAIYSATPEEYWGDVNSVPLVGEDQSLEEVLRGVVEEQMISDVPVGSFLSGGIDSSLITAIMQTQSDRPVQSFTIGYSDDSFDESEYARLVAKELGTDHTRWVITQSDVMDLIPTLPDIYDEPFADSSQLPTVLLSKMTRQAVTVCLSGDGGDELFCGYERYMRGERIYSWLNRLPLSGRSALRRLLNSRNNTEWDNFYHKYSKIIPFSVSHFGDKVNKISALLEVSTPEQFYDRLLSTPGYDSGLLKRTNTYSIVPEKFDDRLSFTEAMMVHDTKNFLTDDIMVKVDRATMSVGLESRAPFLDSRIFEYAWKLPIDSKLVNGVSKYPLRQLLGKYVPEKLIDRPKMGFGLPLGRWLRCELREWAEDAIVGNSIGMSGLISGDSAKILWDEHMADKKDHERMIWNLIVFRSWYERWMTDV